MKTARIIIVGNEILSGKTQDTNTHFLARALNNLGVKLERVEVISDSLPDIVRTVREAKSKADFIFVCGGIGGTPDDRTREAVAEAFSRKLVRHPVAEKILNDFYGDRRNDERMRMSDLPEGCDLIDNPVTSAPGFFVENVFVFAGVPKIMQAMFDTLRGRFQGTPLFEKHMILNFGEGEVSHHMRVIDQKYPTVELGSYPQLDSEQLMLPYDQRRFETQIVMRSQSKIDLDVAFSEFSELIAPIVKKLTKAPR